MFLKELKKISISEILVIVLLIIILLQRCGRTPENPTGPQITRDTVWVHKDSTITKQPQIIKTIPFTIPIDRWNTEYLPDTNYTKLLSQYTELVQMFLASNVYKDSLQIDSLGYVVVKDSVCQNLLLGRKYSYDLHYPIIKETRIIPESKKTQWFAGGFIQGEQGTLIDEIGAGLLIKNKKDQIFGGHVGLSNSGAIQIGLSSYWKIKLK
jgi:hypothetical protein